jgi:hypothetical protein
LRSIFEEVPVLTEAASVAPTTAPESREDWRESRDLPPLLEKVRPFTMVREESLAELARQVRVVLTQAVRGALVECGTWRGGASFLMADLLRRADASDRRVWMFDSFEGIQPPQAIDGPAANAWAADTSGPMYFDNLRAPVEGVRRAAEELGLASWTEIVKGWFDQTLPSCRERIGPIALLRIDADWHASVACVLDQLYRQVADGGLIMLDDYYTYDGCAIAVHEFLGRCGLPHRIESLVGHGGEPVGAVLRKGEPGWQWLRQAYQFAQDVGELLSRGERIVLVDEQAFRSMLRADADVLPLLEHDGQYWGRPADDAAAIRDVVRLRRGGATLLMIAWPCFWWLDHYTVFARWLRANYHCAIENERMIAFDLRTSDER